MTTPKSADRDILMMAAISTIAGLGVPTGSRFEGIEMSDDEAQAMIDDLYTIYRLSSDDDRPLTAAELSDVFEGNTIYGAPYANDPYVLSFGVDGEGLLKIAGRPLETGRWWIDIATDTIHSQWSTSASGRSIPVRYYATSEPHVFKHSGPETALPRENWKMFIVAPGLALSTST